MLRGTLDVPSPATMTYTVKIFGDDNLSVSSSYSEKAGVAVAESAIDVGTMTLN